MAYLPFSLKERVKENNMYYGMYKKRKSTKRIKAAKKAWRTRRKRFGSDGIRG